MPPDLVAENVDRLLSILTMRRGHHSLGEAQFVDKYIRPMDPTVYYASIDDATGELEDMAYRVDVGDGKILFSCHVDTVHRKDPERVKQEVLFDPGMLVAYKQDDECLGADDGVGVWIMLNMIEAGVPGVYMFHRGEECGGIGSKFVTDNFPDDFKGLTAAIAFDRKSDCSVITHQSLGRCCSDEFATALAKLLNDNGCGKLEPDDGGVYTDTAEYTDLIGECTNVSCGYMNEHRGAEDLDVEYAIRLKNACVAAFKTDPGLPQTRKPGEVDPADSWGNWSGYGSWSRSYTPKKPQASAGTSVYELDAMTTAELRAMVLKMSADELVELIRDTAMTAVTALEEFDYYHNYQ